jgi:hypothetical protein
LKKCSSSSEKDSRIIFPPINNNKVKASELEL